MDGEDKRPQADNQTRYMDDYSIFNGIQCAHERPDVTQADIDCNRQDYDIRGNNCEMIAKCEMLRI